MEKIINQIEFVLEELKFAEGDCANCEAIPVEAAELLMEASWTIGAALKIVEDLNNKNNEN